jgi:hypothetical protein
VIFRAAALPFDTNFCNRSRSSASSRTPSFLFMAILHDHGFNTWKEGSAKLPQGNPQKRP